MKKKNTILGEITDWALISALGASCLYLAPKIRDKLHVEPIPVVASLTSKEPRETIESFESEEPTLEGILEFPDPKKEDHDFSKVNDRMLLAYTLLAEMGGQGYEAKHLVGHTILNRTEENKWWNKHSNYPNNSLHAVILKPYQFSCFNPLLDLEKYQNTPDLANYNRIRDPLKGIDLSNEDSWNPAQRRRVEDWKECYEIAGTLLEIKNQDEVDPTNGATHYHTIQNKSNWPSWATQYQPTKVVDLPRNKKLFLYKLPN